MEDLIMIAVLAAIGYWLYRSGKHIGSRKGYNVGRSRGSAHGTGDLLQRRQWHHRLIEGDTEERCQWNVALGAVAQHLQRTGCGSLRTRRIRRRDRTINSTK